MANNTVKVILGMLFLAFSKIKANFVDREFTWKNYGAGEALPTTKRVRMINWTWPTIFSDPSSLVLEHPSYLSGSLTAVFV